MSEIDIALRDAHYSDTLQAYREANPSMLRQTEAALSFGFRAGWQKKAQLQDAWEDLGHEMQLVDLKGNFFLACRLCGVLRGGEPIPCKSLDPSTSSEL
jgi:hypothetical protein